MANGLPLTQGPDSKDVLMHRIPALAMGGAGLVAVDRLAGATKNESPFMRQTARWCHGSGIYAQTEQAASCLHFWRVLSYAKNMDGRRDRCDPQ